MAEQKKEQSFVESVFRWMENLVRLILGWLLKLVGVKLSEEQWAALLQFFRFCVVGVFNTVISLAFNFLTLWLVGLCGWDGQIGSIGGFDRQLATLVGFLASCTNSYCFNSRFTFGTGEKKTFAQHVKAYLKVMISYSFAGLFLGWALNLLWVKIDLNRYLGMILNVIVSIPINFILNKFWAYKEK